MTTEITEAEYLNFLQSVMVNSIPLHNRVIETVTEHAHIAAKQNDPALLVTRLQITTEFGLNSSTITKVAASLIAEGEMIEVKIAGKRRLMPAIKEPTRPEKPQKASKK